MTGGGKHPELQKGFEVTDEILTDFESFLQEKNFDYTSDAESALKKLEETTQNSEARRSEAAHAP